MELSDSLCVLDRNEKQLVAAVNIHYLFEIISFIEIIKTNPNRCSCFSVSLEQEV